MCILNLNFKILGEILVCLTAQKMELIHFLTMCMLNLNFTILGERSWSFILHEESIIFLTKCMLNLNCKILGEMLLWQYSAQLVG